MSKPTSSIIISKPSGIIQRSQRIPGIFPSVRYGEQVVSTGIPSLDAFIGGGIPLGSVCIIKDAFPSRYGDCILKTFIAEGATYNHHIYVASGQSNPEESILSELPTLVVTKNKDDHDATLYGGDNIHNDAGGAGMKIAWRYGHQQSSSASATKDITKFEFSKKTTGADLGAKHITCSRLLNNEDSLESVQPQMLLNEIFVAVDQFRLSAAPSKTNETTTMPFKPPNNLVRICLSHCDEQVLSIGFMPALRALVRHTNSCALIILSDVAGSAQQISRCEHFADYVISLQAVTDEKRRTDLGDIDGICDIVKIASINSLKPIEPPRDLGFSFKKKRIVFHELNLPPEGESTTQREVSTASRQNNPTAAVGGGCGTTFHGKSIDF